MTFASVYEILTPLSTVRKQKFWDWFDGNDAKAWWTEFNSSGTGSTDMTDEVDGGLTLTSSSVNGHYISIFFNDKRHYEPTGCGFVAVARRTDTTGTAMGVGLSESESVITNDEACAGFRDVSSFTLKQVIHNDTTGAVTFTDTAIGVDTSFHTYSAIVSASDIVFKIDGAVTNTASTELPDFRMQPDFVSDALTGVNSKKCAIRYIEVFNT